jgi:hypothetical protein
LEIADWLRGLSLERYAETFRDNAIDVAVLLDLSEAELWGLFCGQRVLELQSSLPVRALRL